MLYLINFKTYEEGLGVRGIKLANFIAEVREKLNADIWAAPQFTDLKEISKIVPTLSQHIDPVTFGSHTGSILPASVKDAGVIGTLINHSERRLPLDKIEGIINISKQLGMKTICCVADIKEVMEIAKFSPDYIAYEDPELIGSGRSIAQEKPEAISKFVEVLKDINPEIIPLCGAGIATKQDVQSAKELGAKGVLVASAIVKAEDHKEALLNLIL